MEQSCEVAHNCRSASDIRPMRCKRAEVARCRNSRSSAVPMEPMGRAAPIVKWQAADQRALVQATGQVVKTAL